MKFTVIEPAENNHLFLERVVSKANGSQAVLLLLELELNLIGYQSYPITFVSSLGIVD